MSHVKNHDTTQVFILSPHGKLHETHLSMYVTTIAVNDIFVFHCHEKAVLYPLVIDIWNLSISFRTKRRCCHDYAVISSLMR